MEKSDIIDKRKWGETQRRTSKERGREQTIEK
jgi:hypothetical protein